MPKRVAITAFFTLPMIRRHLEEFGHGFKLSEIKVALDILSDTSIEVRLDSEGEPDKPNGDDAS